MKAYSVDLRAKVLRAVDQRYARTEIVKLLGVSPATIKRYLKQQREKEVWLPNPDQDGRPRSWDRCKLNW